MLTGHGQICRLTGSPALSPACRRPSQNARPDRTHRSPVPATAAAGADAVSNDTP